MIIKNEENTTYYKNGEKWYSLVHQKQCTRTSLFLPECQGVEGHDGICWSYAKSGYLKSFDGERYAMTPPCHREYIEPKNLLPKYWRQNPIITEIIDHETIDRLNSPCNMEDSIIKPTNEELKEIFDAPNRDNLFIDGFTDEIKQTVTLLRGNFEIVTLPYSAFPVSGDGTVPDFSKLAIIDYGNTVAFGDYEASNDYILDEFQQLTQ